MSKPKPDTAENRAEAAMAEIERAFADILSASEQTARAVNGLSNIADSSGPTADLAAKIQEANARIVAACSSQDVIRQHLEILANHLANPPAHLENPKDGEKSLAGPQIDGQGLKQQDIDEMFD